MLFNIAMVMFQPLIGRLLMNQGQAYLLWRTVGLGAELQCYSFTPDIQCNLYGVYTKITNFLSFSGI